MWPRIGGQGARPQAAGDVRGAERQQLASHRPGLAAAGGGPGVARLRGDPAPGPASPAAAGAGLHRPMLLGATKLVVTAGTTVADVARAFGGLDGKRLRLGRDAQGQTILYTRSPLIRGTARPSEKQAAAAECVRGMVDRQFGRQGVGARLVPGGALPAGGGLRDLERQVGRPVARAAARAGYGDQARAAGAVAAGAFKDGRTHLEEANRVKISEDGGGGVLLARREQADGTSRGVAVLKIEHPVRLAGAAFVSSLAEGVASRVDRPLPFAMPKHELIRNPTEGDLAHLRDTLQALPGAGERRVADKVKLLGEFGQVSKYEYLDGHDLDKLPSPQKRALYAEGRIGADLGRSALLVNALGLGDHLGLSDANGLVNPSNLFVTREGRLMVMDLAGLNQDKEPDGPDGKPPKNPSLPLGLNDEQLTATITDMLGHLEDLASSDKPRDQLLDELISAPRPPLDRIINATVQDGRESNSLFREDEPVMDAADNRNHVAHLLSGAAESLAYLRDNADAFAAAHAATPRSAIKDPEQTFGQLRDLSARIDAVEIGLNQKLGL